MKTLLFVAFAASLLTIGCGEKSSSPAKSTNAASSGNPLTAPVDYLNEAAKAKHAAVKTVDVAAVNKAIDMFSAEKGRYPKDLNELVTENFIKAIPSTPVGSKLNYDAAAGKVTVVKE